MLECCENPRKHHSAVFDKYADKRYKRASSYVETQMLHGFALPKPVKDGFTAPIDSGLLTNVVDNSIVAK